MENQHSSLKPIVATWPAADSCIVDCDAVAVASTAIMSAAHDAPYHKIDQSAGEAPSADDIAFWDRVATESRRIAAWACSGLSICGRATSQENAGG